MRIGLILLIAASLAIATGSASAAGPQGQAAARWCETGSVRIGGHTYWPIGSRDLTSRQIVDRARALILRDVRPRGWRCGRHRGSSGQIYGSCWRGSTYYGVSVPH